MKKTTYVFAVQVCLVAAMVGGCTQDSIWKAEQEEKDRPSGEEIKAIAEEGFIYGLPLVMNYAVNYEFFVGKGGPQYKCPFNQLYNEHQVFTYKDTAVVTPNSDTPYSFASFDLRAEPWVLSVPAVEAPRYYSLQFTDWNTFNIGYVGSRATGREAGDYLLVGPEWKGTVPAGIKGVIKSTAPFFPIPGTPATLSLVSPTSARTSVTCGMTSFRRSHSPNARPYQPRLSHAPFAWSSAPEARSGSPMRRAISAASRPARSNSSSSSMDQEWFG